MNPKYQIEPLDKNKHDREAFSCGVDALDSYLRERASQDAIKKVATIYVLCEVDSPRILGYYTLSMTGITLTSLPEEIIKRLRLPRYPSLPATLMGRLAVETNYQGQGIGKRLLLNALQRCLKVSTEVGTIAVTVDSKGDDSRSFYEKYGFRRLTDQEYSLFLTMADIARLFGNA